MKHWTGDELTEWLYGLKTDASHLDECAECRGRAELAAERRAVAVRAPEVSWDFLAAQRRRIYERLDRPARHWAPARWVASLAMLVPLAVLSWNLMRTNRPATALASDADQQLISELVSIDQSSEPKAIRPIRKMFEE